MIRSTKKDKNLEIAIKELQFLSPPRQEEKFLFLLFFSHFPIWNPIESFFPRSNRAGPSPPTCRCVSGAESTCETHNQKVVSSNMTPDTNNFNGLRANVTPFSLTRCFAQHHPQHAISLECVHWSCPLSSSHDYFTPLISSYPLTV